MVQMEDWASKPPATGFLRLHGHFSGSITTATHCLEVALPLQYDLPMYLAETVVEAFMHQDEQEKLATDAKTKKEDRKSSGTTEEEEKEKCRREKPPLAEIWKQLGIVLHKGMDRQQEQLMEQQGKVGMERSPEGLQHGATASDLETRSRAGSGLRGQGQLARQQRYDASLKVDMEAKEELVRQLQQERDELLEQNHKLHNKSKTDGFKGWLEHLRQGSSAASHTAVSDETEEEKDPDEDHRPVKLEEGEMFLEGTFVGKATTSKHILDVSLPFKGTFSGVRALQVFKTIVQKNSEVESVKEEESKGLKAFARIFEAEYGGRTEDDAGEALQDRPGPPVGTVGVGGTLTNTADVAGMAELSAMLQSREDQLRMTTKELEALRGEHLRVQCEAETLRARGTALAGYMADAEASAQQLRGQLQAQQAAQLQDEQQRSLAWRQGGSQPITPLGSASLGFGSGALQQAGTWRGSGDRGTAEPLQEILADPAAAFQRVTQEAAKEHKALVNDLKELERWAKELRTLSS